MPDGAMFFVAAYAAKLDADKMPVMGADGYFEADKLLFYTAMEQQAGWGKEIPDLYRNGDWNYAVFTGERQLRPGVNQALCFACHKPKAKESYLFTLPQLAAKAKP